MSSKECEKYKGTSSVETDDDNDDGEITGRRPIKQPSRYKDYSAGEGSTHLILLGLCSHVSIYMCIHVYSAQA